ncbi:hypothetical protein MMC21_007495 [Puttea exsequens]|nr:hypothetical protein [Puttea exsequens]
MAQAELMVSGMALASPSPTAPPHPRDLARVLFQRQATSQTCGWIDADFSSPVVCNLGFVCAQNTLPAYNAAFCCNAASYPSICPFATTCLDSSAVAPSCTGLCLANTAVKKCTLDAAPFCVTKTYNYAALPTYITEWDCSPAPGAYTVYDSFSIDAVNGASPTSSVAGALSNVVIGPTSIGPPATTPFGGDTTTSTPTASSSSGSSGLSGGAIAGIVIGSIFLIVSAIVSFFLYRFFTRRHRERIAQQNANAAAVPAAAQQGPPPPTTEQQRPPTFTNPSTTSTTPFAPHPMSELSPGDSASQINGHGSTLSYAPPHDLSSHTGSTVPSNAVSGIGSLPQYSPPIGGGPAAAAASPGSDFASQPAVHAPDVVHSPDLPQGFRPMVPK